jgi:hypothetical protein
MKINQIFSSLLAGGLLLLLTASCKKEINDKIVSPPALSEFGTSTLTGNYFITNSASSSFKIPIGITTVAGIDRTIQLSLTSSTGAASGVQYNAPSSVVIPAGKGADSLVVNGLFAGYPAGRRDILNIKITGGDVPVNTYNNTYSLVMQKYCDVSLAVLGGNYTANELLNDGSFSYGPYSTGVINLTSTGPTSASGDFVNLFDAGWDNIHFTMDWTDPAGFRINIPLQATGASDPAYVRATSGKLNAFSSCDQTFSISVDLLDGTQALEYSGYQFRLTR